MSLRHWGHGLQRDAKCWCRTRSWKWLAPQGTTEPSWQQGCCMGQSSTSSSALRPSKLVPALGSLPACLPLQQGCPAAVQRSHSKPRGSAGTFGMQRCWRAVYIAPGPMKSPNAASSGVSALLSIAQYGCAPGSSGEGHTHMVMILCVKADVRVKCRRTNAACVWSDKLQGCSQQGYLKTVRQMVFGSGNPRGLSKTLPKLVGSFAFSLLGFCTRPCFTRMLATHPSVLTFLNPCCFRHLKQMT